MSDHFRKLIEEIESEAKAEGPAADAERRRIVLTRIDELLDRFSGCLDTDGSLREQVQGLRRE